MVLGLLGRHGLERLLLAGAPAGPGAEKGKPAGPRDILDRDVVTDRG